MGYKPVIGAAPDPDDPSQQIICFVQSGVQFLNYCPILDPPTPFSVEYLMPDVNPISN